MRVLLDDNLLVSGLPATTGTPAEIVDRWWSGQFRLVVSKPLMAEVARAWTKPYWRAHIAPDVAARAITLLRQEADLVAITVVVQGVASHPEDDLVLAAAVSGGADLLVTGDRALQALRGYRGVVILAPLDFLTFLRGLDSGDVASS